MNEALLAAAVAVASGSLVDGPLPFMDMLCLPLAALLGMLAVCDKKPAKKKTKGK